MSAIMKGGKNSLSIYRANILIFFIRTTDAQVNVPQQLQVRVYAKSIGLLAELKDRRVASVHGCSAILPFLPYFPSLTLFISCLVSVNLHFFCTLNII